MSLIYANQHSALETSPTPLQLARHLGCAALLVAGLGLASQAFAKDLAYEGTFAWLAVGTTYTIEENHSYFVGEFGGSFVAADHSGIFNGIGVVCPGFNDIGVSGGGYCVLTDAVGDRAFMNWSCKASAPTPGTLVTSDCLLNFVGGTGKFTGAKGSGPFKAYITAINPNGKASGYSTIEPLISVSVAN
ncbi:MAG: hypothetical protein HY834_19830 [Devosia nanyangense]|uniref:Uncharacterized protein n=1 Tax=Devosia nanyangense TaxID=1228055 RepID=A0A933P038_9HYPH|nr:hypothetical protein [Devosia nanyangense]